MPNKYSNKISDKIYMGYTINNGNIHDYTCDKNSLDKIIDTVEIMSERHSKVHITRLDVRLPQGENIQDPSRKLTRAIEATVRETNRKLKDSPHDPDIQYMRTTEQTSEDKHPHYHLAIFANGNAIQNGYRFLHSLERHVKRLFDTEQDGLVHFSQSNGKKGIMIDRNASNVQEQINNAVYILSYLAKTRDKEHTQKGTHTFSCSFQKK